MAKKLSDIEKREIVEFFYDGNTTEYIANKFSCTNLTIVRNLKKLIGDEKFRQQSKKNKSIIADRNKEEKKISNQKDNKSYEDFGKEEIPITSFMEIAPLDCEIENTPQKDLSSVPINEVDFPKVVFLIVDKQIELETKYLKEHPNWQFLAQDELNRKTIEIYEDLKVAKRFCNKEQKVIKVPNTEVFKIAAPLLISKGISRIISNDILIAL